MEAIPFVGRNDENDPSLIRRVTLRLIFFWQRRENSKLSKESKNHDHFLPQEVKGHHHDHFTQIQDSYITSILSYQWIQATTTLMPRDFHPLPPEQQRRDLSGI
jgi:hypothetical protein